MSSSLDLFKTLASLKDLLGKKKNNYSTKFSWHWMRWKGEGNSSVWWFIWPFQRRIN